jgi:hypothetical protein
MTVIEQAESLRQQAVELLLAERARIDAMLASFGDKKVPVVKRGRPPKLPSGQLCSSESIEL